MHGDKVAALKVAALYRFALQRYEFVCLCTHDRDEHFPESHPSASRVPESNERYCDEQRPDLRMATNITPTRTVLELTLVKSDCQENGQ